MFLIYSTDLYSSFSCTFSLQTISGCTASKPTESGTFSDLTISVIGNMVDAILAADSVSDGYDRTDQDNAETHCMIPELSVSI